MCVSKGRVVWPNLYLDRLTTQADYEIYSSMVNQ
jgi:hypothetical protein